jgi:hypothetical protein
MLRNLLKYFFRGCTVAALGLMLASPLCLFGNEPNAPNFHIDAFGNKHAIWEEDHSDGTSAVMFSTMTSSGSTWSTPITISNSSTSYAYTPSVALDANGDVLAAWLEDVSSTTAIVASIRKASSGTWSTPATLSSTTNEQVFAPFQISIINTLAGVAWISYLTSPGEYAYSSSTTHISTISWTTPAVISN